MSFKCLPRDVTGRIEIYRFGTFYRLTSCMYALGLSGTDLNHGLDEFLPTTVSDAEFGAAIRRCHDATRFEDWNTLPRGEAAKAASREWKKKLVLWKHKALEMTACQNLEALYEDARYSNSRRTKGVYVFFNSSLDNPTEFFDIPDHFPDCREFIVKQSASDEMLGQAARAALDAGVRNAMPPPRVRRGSE
ncbi:hypothetical protein [Verminephrobacter aporrectodeae]|uniref:DUF1436 family protein n=1 Tax=Verminephrobacter aporrectodeae subsp. tuberculatae TaxID=1110392 RepID=A0ABT3KRH2_9BURK|nr:hypothetical protein [Verminephrobacter aporrectodeae]MCW5220126.1 hypothetical protein [Verminephrobacter aporrectodeae subsp. tuberculatae]MCW5255910.1 hypothetical protein [Verminephrobacter aporrectodeae subsp. tuberculatae]MCW5289414.1 hypothetical protein [Verminephrobacter aporrectodeae subsp. tuberculatae]MCW5320924.1 hypothetical protein [Verminephrobacter aporrectodeae subsp. tuberculatae]MCW8165606.1 hypothetical protein [Verminephrobacter aporrectodeae subsp. tuberculatae]